MPRTLARLELTGYTVPPKGLLIRFHRMLRPTLPAFSVAPITATDFGAKNTFNALVSTPDGRSHKLPVKRIRRASASKFVRLR